MICQECGTGVNASEYHPRAFCVLYNAGIDPFDFIREAIPHVLTDDEIHHEHVLRRYVFDEVNRETDATGNRL